MKEASSPLYKLQKGDKLIFALYFIVVSTLLLITDEDPKENWIEDLFMVLLLVGNSIVIVYFSIFRWLKRDNKRSQYLSLALKVLLLVLLLIGIEWVFFDHFIEGVTETSTSWMDLVGVLFVILLLSGVLLGIIMVKKGVDAQIQVLKTENLRKSSELKALKNQLDPHFLFNNFNTLDALIDTDTKKAKIYIQRFAKLYQYLLSVQEEDTVSLEEEMSFANDYMYMIKERFGDNYQFKVIDERKTQETKLIPPAAVQTVLENIVKHNTATKACPIIAELVLQDEQLVITNTIRSKETPATSFGIGLSNLQSRYELLSNRQLEVEISDVYLIRLPLIRELNNTKHESHNN